MFFRCVVLLVFFCLQAVSTLESHADDQDVASLIRKHWDWTLSQSPVFAGQLGDRSGDGKLPDVSIKNTIASAEQLRRFLESAREIEVVGLTDHARLN